MKPDLDHKSIARYESHLPAKLRTALEALSGYDMADVRVHYNSDQPALINAHAFAYGTAIYLAPGQERHLLHEAWHVVQQKQVRVKPTLWLINGMGLNDDIELEAEAESIANILLARLNGTANYLGNAFAPFKNQVLTHALIKNPVLQRVGLESLLKPKINQLNAAVIPVQKSLIEALNKKIEKLPNDHPSRSVSHICSLILVNTLDGNFAFDLVEPITSDGLNTGSYIPVNYELIKNEYLLKEFVKTVVKTTLIQSGQLEYLLNNNLPDNEWQIYVDFHYYFTRPDEAAGFHRDSIGHTLFVNLNYNNQNDFKGAEFLIDLDKYQEHALYIASKLPPVFLADIEKVKDKKYEGPDIIDFGEMRPNGIISWVDELVDHSTPYLGHRGVTAEDFLRFINEHYFPMCNYLKNIMISDDKLDEVLDESKLKEVLKYEYCVNDIMLRLQNNTVNGKLVKDYIGFLFKTLFEPVIVSQIEKKRDEILAAQNSAALIKYDELKKIFSDNQILFEGITRYGNPNMGVLNITHISDGKLESNNEVIINAAQRKRRMSISLEQSGLSNFPPGEKRQFIRTWVQARKIP